MKVTRDGKKTEFSEIMADWFSGREFDQKLL